MGISDLSTLVSLLALLITWLIIQPLKTSISNLQTSIDTNTNTLEKSVNKLADVIEQTQQDVTRLRIKMGKHEEAIKHGLERIEALETRMQALESRCIECNCKE